MCLKGSLGTMVAGDFNCPPDSLEMHMFRAFLPQLHDCWEQLHPQQPGFTSNAVNNSFTKPGESIAAVALNPIVFMHCNDVPAVQQ